MMNVPTIFIRVFLSASAMSYYVMKQISEGILSFFRITGMFSSFVKNGRCLDSAPGLHYLCRINVVCI